MDASTVPVSAADAVATFFTRSRLLRHPALAAHAGAVRGHLETYLDTEAETWLTPDEAALVAAERQVDPAGAVARVCGPEALVAALPGFLDPEWLSPDVAVAHTQLLAVDALVRWLLAEEVVDAGDVACSVLDVEVALVRASALLAEHRARARGPAV